MDQNEDNRRADGFKPKYRHFHPHDRVWIKNPFEHDVVYQVADEYNRPYKYRLVAGKVSELPGGAIATLGVKAIVDELIQNDANDNQLMWDERIRAKHEASVIQQVKSTRPRADASRPGEINLTVASSEDDADEAFEPQTPPEEEFAGLNDVRAEETPPSFSTPPPAVASELNSIVAASLPKHNTVTEAQ